MVQLRNLVNRRNVGSEVSGRFNASIDFFEMVTNCYIVAAAMTFFGMASIHDDPTSNALPSDILQWDAARQWNSLSTAIGKLIDHYVIVRRFVQLAPHCNVPRPLSSASDLHVQRVAIEHMYCSAPIQMSGTRNLQSCSPHLLSQAAILANPHVQRVAREHTYCSAPVQISGTRKRRLPHTITIHSTLPHASPEVHDIAPDAVFDYSSTVLNDGLLMLEFRDAIHEGDGDRILRCWKFMLLYFRFAGKCKYALEAFHLLANVNAICSTRLAAQIKWSRAVNTRGGKGNNLPVDLYMEHLNRCLKDYIIGLGANITENMVVACGKSLNGMMAVTSNFDNVCNLHRESLHHTTKSSTKDEELIIKELTSNSKVFDYIPGRAHRAFGAISPNVASCINANKLFKWLNEHKKAAADDLAFHELVGFL